VRHDPISTLFGNGKYVGLGYLARQARIARTAPSSGTPTSDAAAMAISESAHTLRARVLGYLLGLRERGATDEEAQHALGMNPSTQRPRRGELVEQGLVRDSGRTRATLSGRQAVVWVAEQETRNERI